MAVLTTGHTFADGQQVTSDRLNNIANAATFASAAVDGTTTQLSSGAIIVKDLGISTGKIASSAITTVKLGTNSVSTAKIIDSNVTKAKIENFTNLTVLGNVSGSAATPAEVTIIDDDTMGTASATTLATSESVKAYVDTQIGANNDLSEILANDNETGANNIIVTAGQAITTDTVSETTGAAGVTVDSLLIKDGGITAAGTSTFAGQTISDLGTVTTANIDGGSIDGATVGASSASTGAFTTLTASDDVNFDSGTLFVDASASKAGIGTTSPAFDLDVNGDVNVAETLVVDRPSDAWTTNTTWLTVGQGGSNDLYGTINTGGSYALTYNGNGYRNSSSQWESFGVNSNTGATQIWQYPAGYITFNANNNWASGSSSVVTERMRIDGVNGYVGINDATPSYQLDVNGTGRFTSTVRFDGQTQNYNGAYDIYRSGAGYLRHRIADQTLSIGVTNTAGTVHYPIVLSPSNDVLQFNNEEGEMARFDTSGSLGIGTTSPANALHIVGNDEETSAINTATATALEVAGNGSSPNSGGTILFSAASGSWKFAAIKSLVTSGSNNTQGDLAFSTRPVTTDSTLTEAMRIKSSGNVGIGNSAASYKLDVNGTFRTTDDIYNNISGTQSDLPGYYRGTYGAQIESTATGSTLHIARSGGNCMNIGADSNATVVYFRDTSAGSTVATEVGSISITSSATAFNTSSDYRLKENEVSITDGIDRLKQLSPYRFNFKVDPDKIVDGFFAHEVSDVVPEAIRGEKDGMKDEEYEVSPAVYEDVVHPAVEATYDEDGQEITPAEEEWTESVLVSEAVMGTRSVPDYQGIDQSKLVPLLTAALQEAVAKIEALEARVQTLEG
jgi:hypothetical protein